jgi:hypothetical protein
MSGTRVTLAALLLATALPAAGADRYVETTVNDAGELRIVTGTGSAILIRKQRDQVGFDQIAISPTGQSVGWVVLEPNCCTSYPIPLQLVIYSDGARRTFTGLGLPIWHWRFTAGGRQVAFHQETVHGGLGTHYELRDVDSGRLIAQHTPKAGPDNQILPGQTVPEWVTELNATQ